MNYITRPKEKGENLKRKVNLFIDPKSCHSPKLSFLLCLLSFYHPSFSIHLHSRFDLISTLNTFALYQKIILDHCHLKVRYVLCALISYLRYFLRPKKKERKEKKRRKKLCFHSLSMFIEFVVPLSVGFFFHARRERRKLEEKERENGSGKHYFHH
jgi:preprotein translocase subunit YajC